MEIGRIAIIIIFIILSNTDRSGAQGPTLEVQAVIKGSASLPCNIQPPIKNDSAILVVWYRNEMDAIYSYDSRGKVSESGSHWSNSTVIGNRAFFRIRPEPATLIIEDLKESDAGSYRCRVDFQKSPTKNNKIRLQVVKSPEKPLIYDHKGKVTSVSGPFEENTDVKLLCRVYGGDPTPKVRWWKNERLLDSITTVNTEQQYVESELIIHKVSRSDLKATYTCQASNNNISMPEATSVILDLYLSPLEVTILSSRQQLSADRKFEVVCQTVGSRPPAKITWWKDNERMTDYNDTISADGNVTTSTLVFVPTIKDHNKTLICRAMNTKIKTAVAEDMWLLDITFLPTVTLEFGPQLLNPNDIEEGDDVFFQCKVHANPRAYKVVWKQNGYVIQHDPKSGIIISSGTLELRSVKKHHNGNYTCFASNVEGDNESNPLELRVMYKPVCKGNQKQIYGFAPDENGQITCEVDAYPFADAFRWYFNNSEAATMAEKHRKSERKRNVSIFHITPVSDVHYGYLLCSATNLVGEQAEPCVFRIIPAGRPQPPQNCTIVNQTSSSLGVECTPGFDGGQSALFILDVINGNSGTRVTNISASTPTFYIGNLSPSTTLTLNLYAENGRGRSPMLIVEGSTLSAAEKRTGISSMISFTPYMVLLIGLTVFCSLSAVVIMGAVRAQTLFGTASPCFRTQRNSPSIKQDLSALDQAIRFDIVDEDEKNPDVIPSTKDDNYEVLRLNQDDVNASQGHYYPNNNSTKSASRSSLLSLSQPFYKDASWHLTNTVSRNGDLHGRRHCIRLNKKGLESKADYMQLSKEVSNELDSRTSDQVNYCTLRKNELSSSAKLQNAAPCNVIKMSSQKEIVTVRTLLVSHQQESCV